MRSLAILMLYVLTIGFVSTGAAVMGTSIAATALTVLPERGSHGKPTSVEASARSAAAPRASVK